MYFFVIYLQLDKFISYAYVEWQNISYIYKEFGLDIKL